MKKFKKYLEEKTYTRLIPSELIKPNGKTQVARTTILRDKIQGGEDLVLSNGKTIKVADPESVLNALDQFMKDEKPFAILGADGNSYSSSDLGKTSEFGGGGGAGSGTKATAYNESAQCVWLQAMLDHGYQNSFEYFTDDILSDAFKKVDTGKTKLKDILNISDAWKNSSYLAGKFIIEKGYVTKGMTFHRDSKLMKEIYKAKDKAFKNNGFGKFSHDKWNPGDIWAAAPDFKISEIKTDSVEDLNKSIMQLYVDRRLVGISLKLVVKKPKAVERNVERPPDTDDHKVLSVAVQSNRGTFWSSKSSSIVYDSGSAEIKDNAYLGSNKMEIKGKTARGGGAGWGIIVDASRQVLKKKLPDHSNIKKTAIRAAKGDKRALDVVWKLTSYMEPNMSREEFDKEISAKDAGWISAKLGGLYLTSIIKSNMGTKANRFLTKLINYAASKSEDASAHVVIKE
jgi:hypothetical protein